uniref:ABC transmembrane type-2 domain-containing protein n=1 Tax=Ophidocladus simpliciusculus TaxID=1261574 RepID=A0A1Z1MJX4_9FLOR|nr:hypothetical protein [Ophidocladus simpliciusculus]ARW66061.1 hypothetical protein [Ophidocladus simpliciusculus]
MNKNSNQKINKKSLQASKLLIPNTTIIRYMEKFTIHKETQTILKRLYLQTYRRPSSMMISIIQPLLWLLLFGALFENAPIYLFEGYNIQYREFLNPGIIIFTAFNGSINAGLTIMFDREFGFLNRILISPLINKSSLIYSSIIYTLIITIIEIIIILLFSMYQTDSMIKPFQWISTIIISTIIIIKISNISIYNAFILPGHIEFIALTTLFINLPTLFASTALAPLSFMPYWLQIITCLNPLTYAIEIIRYSNLNANILSLNTTIINTLWFQVQIKEGLIILIFLSIISFLLTQKIIKYKYD